MSTPEEIERERAQLVELSETMRQMAGAVRAYRTENVGWFDAALARIRETNASPEMRELEDMARQQDPDYNPRMVEEVLEMFIARMSAELEKTERDAENTWLGIEESIIALDETGEVPLPSDGILLPDRPPQPGPDDDL